MKNLLLLKDITVLELYAHLGRPNLAEYVHLHANRLRAMVTGNFKKYRVSLHYDNFESMARSYGELSLTFINSPDVNLKRWHKLLTRVKEAIMSNYQINKNR